MRLLTECGGILPMDLLHGLLDLSGRDDSGSARTTVAVASCRGQAGSVEWACTRLRHRCVPVLSSCWASRAWVISEVYDWFKPNASCCRRMTVSASHRPRLPCQVDVGGSERGVVCVCFGETIVGTDVAEQAVTVLRPRADTRACRRVCAFCHPAVQRWRPFRDEAYSPDMSRQASSCIDCATPPRM